MSADGPEDPALANLGRDDPTTDRLLNPHGHGHGSHTADLANQVDNGPVSQIKVREEVTKHQEQDVCFCDMCFILACLLLISMLAIRC